MKTILSFVLVLFMMIGTFFGSFTEKAPDLVTDENALTSVELGSEEKALLKLIFESETAWIASLQLDNGAIPMTSAKNGILTMNPYFADFAALALLDNAQKYGDNVKKYIEWHFSHLNSAKSDYNNLDGAIYDYNITVENGSVVKEEIAVKDGKYSYDSTDSYAATFLMVLDKYQKVTGDNELIISNSDDIARVTDVIFATLNMGLTYAKPDYKVKYLMDNCEVYDGILAAKSLFENVICKNSDAYKMYLLKCKYASGWISQNIENTLWNVDGGHYEAAVFTDGEPAFQFSWDEYYPSATAQLFPIMHGLIASDSVRAVNLYNRFSDEYDWQSFDIPDDFYWGSNVYVAAMMNDVEAVMEYMLTYSSLLINHSYPLYNADAAKVAMAAKLILEKAEA